MKYDIPVPDIRTRALLELEPKTNAAMRFQECIEDSFSWYGNNTNECTGVFRLKTLEDIPNFLYALQDWWDEVNIVIDKYYLRCFYMRIVYNHLVWQHSRAKMYDAFSGEEAQCLAEATKCIHTWLQEENIIKHTFAVSIGTRAYIELEDFTNEV